MDSEQLQQVLQRIAEKNIPDDVDLWPKIEKRIAQQKSRRFVLLIQRQWSLAFVTVTIAFSLLFLTGSYVLSQYLGLIPGFDYGMEQTWRDNLGVDLETSQTIDGVTVTLNRAYADANRIVVYYTAARDTAHYDPVRIDANVLLTDGEGRELEQIFGGGGGGGGSTGEESVSTTWELEGSHNFDARVIEGNPSEANLHFELLLQVVPSSTHELAAIGPFAFDFSVPLIPVVVIEPQQTVVTQGLPMTLERAWVTPSSTRVRVCFVIDHPNETWMPVATLAAGDNNIKDLGFLRIQPRSETVGNRRCVEMDFLAPYDRQPTQRTLVVERLESAPAWNPAVLEAGLQAYGIQIAIYEDEQRFEVISAPPGVDIEGAIAAVQSSLSGKIEGPWVFPLDIP